MNSIVVLCISHVCFEYLIVVDGVVPVVLLNLVLVNWLLVLAADVVVVVAAVGPLVFARGVSKENKK